MFNWGVRIAIIALLLWLSGAALYGISRQVNLAEMVEDAGVIVAGRCVEVKEGTHPQYPNIPVLYVTIEVKDILKGSVQDSSGSRVRLAAPRGKLSGGSGARQTFTFMQFGGSEFPDLPGYHAGEELLLFLYPESRYGLTSPVGGAQGKFSVGSDPETGKRTLTNRLNNANLFRGVSAADLGISETEANLLARRPGEIDYDTFSSLVKRLSTLKARERKLR